MKASVFGNWGSGGFEIKSLNPSGTGTKAGTAKPGEPGRRDSCSWSVVVPLLHHPDDQHFAIRGPQGQSAYGRRPCADPL